MAETAALVWLLVVLTLASAAHGQMTLNWVVRG